MEFLLAIDKNINTESLDYVNKARISPNMFISKEIVMNYLKI